MVKKPNSTPQTALVVIAYAVIPFQAAILYILATGEWTRPSLFVSSTKPEYFYYLFGYIVLLSLGITAASLTQKWTALSLQAILPITLVAFNIYCILRPITKYNANQHQHLIGQNIKDVRKELDSRNVVTGWTNETQHVSFRGMKILTGRDGVITEVKPNNRQ